MLIVTYILTGLAAYLLGSVPTGYLAGRMRGLDIRTMGSGNMGATNVLRVLGKKAGAAVLLIDALKGYAACAWLPAGMAGLGPVPAEQMEYYQIVAGICAVLGHNYTCWLGFKGGKGVATSAGVFLALAPVGAGVAILTWIIVFALTKYVSVASIAGAVALPVTVWLMHNSLILEIVSTAIGLLAIIKHRANIQRLMNGTENRFGNKRQDGTVTASKP